MILHTLNAGPDGSAFQDCLRIATDGDAILLTGNGVYAALDNTVACSELLAAGAEVFILEADARAAGIVQRLSTQVRLADFDGFVTLTERFSRQLAWY